MNKRTKQAATALAFATLLGGIGAGRATATPWNRLEPPFAQYTKTRLGSTEAPDRVIIRCDGWTEDSINTLDLRVFERTEDGGLRVVYRCLEP